MKRYGVYLTIDGGYQMKMVYEYDTPEEAVETMRELAEDPARVAELSAGIDGEVTCLEVLDHDNYTTEEFVPMI